MKIENKRPPNWREVKHLNPPEDAIFCYGDTIYNPSGKEIAEDIIFHESVHSNRQKAFVTPSSWWLKYITDLDFRLNEELLAYGAQYVFIKRHYPSKSHKEALFELSKNLSSIYGLSLTYPQAESKIRWTAKNMLH